MIKSFDLSYFYDFPDQNQPNIYDVRLFQIYGIVGDDLSHFGDPCKIRVSPHRFLTVRIFPGLFSVSFWAKNGHNTIKSGFHFVAELKREKTGYVFDAWEFLLSNKIMVITHHIDVWRYRKANIQYFAGEIINTTNCGLMNYDYILYGNPRVVSAFYSPEIFTICDHEIQGISVSVPVHPQSEQGTTSIISNLNQGFTPSKGFSMHDWTDFSNTLTAIQVDKVHIYSPVCSCVIVAASRITIAINSKNINAVLNVPDVDIALKCVPKILDAARNQTLQTYIAKHQLLYP